MSHPVLRVGRFRLGRWSCRARFLADSFAVLAVALAVCLQPHHLFGDDLPENVLLDFTAAWCGPCQQMTPMVHKLQKQGYAIRKVDVDQHPKLASSYRVTEIPTFILIVDGQEVSRCSGVMSEEKLRRLAMQAGNQLDPEVGGNSRLQPNAAPAYDQKLHPKIALGPARKSLDQPKTSDGKPDKLGGLLPKPKFPSIFPIANKSKPSHRDPMSRVPEVRANNSDAEGESSGPAKIHPLHASVRIRVLDESGANFGSGTIVDSRVGRSIILTCGHLFKSQAADDAPAVNSVEVDIFQPDGRHETYVGKVVDFDLAGDVGVISINTAGILPISPIAEVAHELPIQTRLNSIGCGGGESPSQETVRVTALNRYDGPDNVECTGLPVQGRSGGGLFDSQGHLVGLCIAADQEGHRGLYAGLKPIHALLTRANLKQVLPPSPPEAPASASPSDSSADLLADHTETETPDEPAPSLVDQAFTKADLDWIESRGVPSADDLARMFADAPDAEVICIVRPRNGAEERVVILNQASTKFVSYLLDAVDAPRTTPTTASLRVEETMTPTSTARSARETIGVPKRAADHHSSRRAPKASAGTVRGSQFGSRFAE